jgi:hypothetical protein
MKSIINSFLLIASFLIFNSSIFAQSDGIYNVAKFGAKGDGLTDCSKAFQRAMDAIVEEGSGQLFIPKGSFLIKKQIVAPNCKQINISIVGLGLGISNIFCDNETGVFQFSFLNINSQFTIKELSLFAIRPNAGTAFDFCFLKKGNAHHRALMMQNVEMRGKDIGKDYFSIGVKADNIWRPLFTSVIFAGPFGKDISTDLSKESLSYKAKVAFDVSHSYAPRFVNCYAWAAEIGYKMVDEDEQGAEDGALLNSFAVECGTGVDVFSKGVEPQLLIDGGHYNCRDYGLKINGRKFVNIINCLMYNVDRQSVNPNYTDIYLENCNNVILSANIFQFPGNINRQNIVVGNKCFEIDIKNNRFNAVCNGITVEKTARTVIIKDNGFTQKMLDKLKDNSKGEVITDLN